jgi:hypothetical protein
MPIFALCLAVRPDLLAKVAIVQAKEAQLRAARADLLPQALPYRAGGLHAVRHKRAKCRAS